MTEGIQLKMAIDFPVTQLNFLFRLKHAEKRQRKKRWKRKEGQEERVSSFRYSNQPIHLLSFRKKTQEKEENAIKEGIHNSNLWEARLNIMELARKHYRFDWNSSIIHWFFFL